MQYLIWPSKQYSIYYDLVWYAVFTMTSWAMQYLLRLSQQGCIYHDLVSYAVFTMT